MVGREAKKEYFFPMAPNRLERWNIFLRSHREIQVVKQHGRRTSTALFNLLAHKMDDAPSRVGIIVGRRFGNAVRRNRAKRVFRELVRHSYPRLVSGRGVLVFPKRDALLQPREVLAQVWMASLLRMHLVGPEAH